MSEITAIVTQEDLLSVSTNVANPIIMDYIEDVDLVTNGKLDGSVLVYKTTTNKWTSTTTLDAQNMEGGEF
jgi:hypothetical protein